MTQRTWHTDITQGRQKRHYLFNIKQGRKGGNCEIRHIYGKGRSPAEADGNEYEKRDLGVAPGGEGGAHGENRGVRVSAKSGFTGLSLDLDTSGWARGKKDGGRVSVKAFGIAFSSRRE